MASIDKEARNYMEEISPLDHCGLREHLKSLGLYNLVIGVMVGFAESYGKALLEKAAENAEVVESSETDGYENWEVWEVNKDSILKTKL